MGNRTRHLALGALLLIVIAMGTAGDANVRVPTDAGPFYARVERGPQGEPLVHNDGEWAVIPFYRSTACVPAGFNLLDLFDAPGAFGCEARVVGFEVWKALPPPPGGAPLQVLTFGLDDMEIWFVRWGELSAAMTDDQLTIGELETLPSLVKGTATLFKETLHPVGGARQTKLQMVGSGTLEDRRAFSFSSEENQGRIVHATIRIQ